MAWDYRINRKRVQRLMGIWEYGVWHDTRDEHQPPSSAAQVYSYLLRGVAVIRLNQAWSTYIHLTRGFLYLMAVIDWCSHKVLPWRLSNTLDSGFSMDCQEQALQAYGKSFYWRGHALA